MGFASYEEILAVAALVPHPKRGGQEEWWRLVRERLYGMGWREVFVLDPGGPGRSHTMWEKPG